MLNYEYHSGRSIPYTAGRYAFKKDLNVVEDRYYNKTIEPVDGLWTLPNTKYPKGLTRDELYLLSYKPINLLQDDFFDNFRTDKIQIISVDDKEPSINTIFWKVNVECSLYPEHYYVNGFTNYVISEDGELVSLIASDIIRFSISSVGYLCCRINRDDGKSRYVSQHSLLALTFKEWDQDILDLVVDHLDGNKLNNDLPNLEYVSLKENVTRAHKMGLIPVSNDVYCYDFETKKAFTTHSQPKLSKILGIRQSTISNHLRKSVKYRLLLNRYFIENRIKNEDGEYVDGFDLEKPNSILRDKVIKSNERHGSQPKKVVVKIMSTGEILTFPSGSSFVSWSGLTRKQAYETLKKRSQKKYGDIIFKYEDDDSEWKE